ncbi:MAG: response regulator [Xenococcaceae cyanobacterium]
MLIALLHEVSQKQFTGIINVKLQDSKQVTEWKIYLCLGKLIWADGGVHPFKALRRHLKNYCPQVDRTKINFSLDDKFKCQEYCFFSNLLQKEIIQQNQLKNIIIQQIQEILFDILQKEATESISINSQEIPTSSLLEYGLKISNAAFDVSLITKKVQELWLMWIKRELTSISPNYSPIIVDANKLKQVVSPVIYKNFSSWLNGKHSLRDLAVKMNKDLLKLTVSLMPYVKQELAKFIEIKDLQLVKKPDNLLEFKKTSADRKPIIACIDDSPQVIYIMEQIITKSGYRFLGVQEAIKAIPSLISNIPDMIFLDIGMPVLNGYEICSQIQRVSKLQNVPIVMLTGNDGIVDRVRAKLVGADDFVAKPIETEVIIKTIKKFTSSQSEDSPNTMLSMLKSV